MHSCSPMRSCPWVAQTCTCPGCGLPLGCPWVVHGLPVGCCPWVAHGLPIIGCPWAVRGPRARCPCFRRGMSVVARGVPMACWCAAHGLPVTCPWVAHGLTTGCPWSVRGLLMGFRWVVHGLPMGCPWIARELPTGCPWHGVPRDSPWRFITRQCKVTGGDTGLPRPYHSNKEPKTQHLTQPGNFDRWPAFLQIERKYRISHGTRHVARPNVDDDAPQT